MTHLEDITKDSPETLAFRAFGQELDHIKTASHLLLCNNYSDAIGFQAMADKCLDLGWETLEEAGYRHCDISKFRHEAHISWGEKFPLSFPIGGLEVIL